jgi:hypothetical protein
VCKQVPCTDPARVGAPLLSCIALIGGCTPCSSPPFRRAAGGTLRVATHGVDAYPGFTSPWRFNSWAVRRKDHVSCPVQAIEGAVT